MWEKEKMLVTSISSFSENVFKSLLFHGFRSREKKSDSIGEKVIVMEKISGYQTFPFSHNVFYRIKDKSYRLSIMGKVENAGKMT